MIVDPGNRGPNDLQVPAGPDLVRPGLLLRALVDGVSAMMPPKVLGPPPVSALPAPALLANLVPLVARPALLA